MNIGIIDFACKRA